MSLGVVCRYFYGAIGWGVGRFWVGVVVKSGG